MPSPCAATGELRQAHLRQFFAAASAAPLASFALLPGLDLVLASVPGGTLRISMAAASRRLPIGHTDQGGEGQRCIGDTVCDRRMVSNLSRRDAPSRPVPNLGTAQRGDPADSTRSIFRARPGVRCHDGSVFTAHAPPWTFEEDLAPARGTSTRATLPRGRSHIASVAKETASSDDIVDMRPLTPDALLPYGIA